jgi:hypothetical protein
MEAAGRGTGSLKSDSCMSCAIRIMHLRGFTGILSLFFFQLYVGRKKKEITNSTGKN